jgi:hypothetical protein
MRKWLRSLNLHIIVAEALVPPAGLDQFRWLTSLRREHVEERMRAKDLGGLTRFVWASLGSLHQQGGAATFEHLASSKFAGRTELDCASAGLNPSPLGRCLAAALLLSAAHRA